MSDNMNFEEAMNKLEQSAQSLKSGTLSIEESVKIYEDSIKYYNYCLDFLKNARQKIEIYRPENEAAEDLGEI